MNIMEKKRWDHRQPNKCNGALRTLISVGSLTGLREKLHDFANLHNIRFVVLHILIFVFDINGALPAELRG